MNKVVHKLFAISGKRERNILLRLNPKIELLPIPIARYDDPFLPFSKEIIRATKDLVCGYIFDFSSYLALGAAGIVALERSIAFVPSELVTIVHGPFWGTEYSPMMGKLALNVDAVTLIHPADTESYPGWVLIDEGLLDSLNDSLATYWLKDRKLTIQLESEQLDFQITNDRILYAGKLDDFAIKVRDTILNSEWGT